MKKEKTEIINKKAEYIKEKLIITVEIEDLPENSNILDFQLTIIEDGFLSRIFKGWKKVTYKKAVISDMKVEKFSPPKSSSWVSSSST